MKGKSPRDKWIFGKGDGTKVDHQDCIFPILKMDKEGKYKLLGTGFYICRQNIFITATHVLKDVFDPVTGQQKEPICVFHISQNNRYMILPIVWAWHSNDADISIGLTALATHNVTGDPLENGVLTLTLRHPEVGEEVVTYAYPDFTNTQEGIIQKLYFRPNFYCGRIVKLYPNGRDKIIMPWPCYQTDVHIHGGSSGGPVLDKNGRVFGINCSSMDPDTDISFVTPIEFILGAHISNIRLAGEKSSRNIPIRELIDKKIITLE